MIGAAASSRVVPGERGSARDLAAALSLHGLIIRGGFYPEPQEEGMSRARTVILVGNAGGAMWDAFARHLDAAPNPLDRWTKQVVEPIAERFAARALYPFGADAPSFQRWALRAETLHPSPLGILIHPEYGLWHAWRAALLFAERLALPARSDAPSPCAACAEKPCLSACPVRAFDGTTYDVAGCADHIASPEADCASIGCHARNACPVGTAWRYGEAQARFHMAAFARAVASAAPPRPPG